MDRHVVQVRARCVPDGGGEEAGYGDIKEGSCCGKCMSWLIGSRGLYVKYENVLFDSIFEEEPFFHQ